MSITSLDLAHMDNFSVLMQANQNEYIHDFSGNPVNAMFNMSKVPNSSPKINELSFEEQEIQERNREEQTLKELRAHLSNQENRQISNKELLDLYSSQYQDDDMIIF